MDMDWRPASSRDYSLVIWSTEQEVTITPDDSGTVSSTAGFPYTTPRATDTNAARENGSDACFENPKNKAFR